MANAGSLLIALRLIPLVGVELLFLALRSALVAVVGLIVKDDDVLLRSERPADPSDHLVRGLLELICVTFGAGEDLLRKRGDPLEGPSIAANEPMEVRDLDFCGLERVQLIRRQEIALLAVVARQVRSEDLQTVADRAA